MVREPPKSRYKRLGQPIGQLPVVRERSLLRFTFYGYFQFFSQDYKNTKIFLPIRFFGQFEGDSEVSWREEEDGADEFEVVVGTLHTEVQ